MSFTYRVEMLQIAHASDILAWNVYLSYLLCLLAYLGQVKMQLSAVLLYTTKEFISTTRPSGCNQFS